MDAATTRDAGADAYLYSFDFIDYFDKENGPYHSVDLTYLFGIHPFELDERGKKIRKYYGQFFSNFAKYGKPDPKAEKLRSPGFNYFKVDLEPKAQEFYHFDAVQFWRRVVPYLERFPSKNNTELSNESPASAENATFLNQYLQVSETADMKRIIFRQNNLARNHAHEVSLQFSVEQAKKTVSEKGGSMVAFGLLGGLAGLVGLSITVVLGLAMRRQREPLGERTPLLIE